MEDLYSNMQSSSGRDNTLNPIKDYNTQKHMSRSSLLGDDRAYAPFAFALFSNYRGHRWTMGRPRDPAALFYSIIIIINQFKDC